jgi:hypothetical protein
MADDAEIAEDEDLQFFDQFTQSESIKKAILAVKPPEIDAVEAVRNGVGKILMRELLTYQLTEFLVNTMFTEGIARIRDPNAPYRKVALKKPIERELARIKQGFPIFEFPRFDVLNEGDEVTHRPRPCKSFATNSTVARCTSGLPAQTPDAAPTHWRPSRRDQLPAHRPRQLTTGSAKISSEMFRCTESAESRRPATYRNASTLAQSTGGTARTRETLMMKRSATSC